MKYGSAQAMPELKLRKYHKSQLYNMKWHAC